MTQHLHTRVANSDDLDRVHALLTELFTIEQDHFHLPSEPIRNGLARVLSEGNFGTILVLEEAGEVIGMVNLQPIFSTAIGEPAILLEDYILSEQVRGKGYGSHFMDQIKAYCKDNGYKRITLLTDEDNAGAQRFYEKNGYAFTHSILMKTML